MILYTRTDGTFHHEIVREVFLKLLDRGFHFQKGNGTDVLRG